MSLLNNYLYVYIYVIVLREGVYKNLNVFPLYNCTPCTFIATKNPM